MGGGMRAKEEEVYESEGRMRKVGGGKEEG